MINKFRKNRMLKNLRNNRKIIKMEFKNLEEKKKGNVLEFDVLDLSTSMANALRRTILGEIKNVGFLHGENGTIRVIKNTTGLHNEFLSHRVSMLALKSSEFSGEAIRSMEKLGLEDDNEELRKYKFVLNVSQKDKTWITTDDFAVYNEDLLIASEKSEFFPRDPFSEMPSIITRFPLDKKGGEPEELHIECYPTILRGKDYTGFSPTCVSVIFPKGDGHHFIVESVGSIHPKKIVHMAMMSLTHTIDSYLKDLNMIKKNMEEGVFDMDVECQIKVEPVETELYTGINYTFENETHTIGNMVQEWIYSHEIVKENSRLEQVSYREPHPLSNTIILQLSLKRENKEMSLDDYMKKSNSILIENLESLHEKFILMKRLWVQQVM